MKNTKGVQELLSNLKIFQSPPFFVQNMHQAPPIENRVKSSFTDTGKREGIFEGPSSKCTSVCELLAPFRSQKMGAGRNTDGILFPTVFIPKGFYSTD